MLNYTAHAIEEMKVLSRSIFNAAPLTSRAIDKFIKDVQESEKFLLPDYGSLIYNLYEMPEGIEMTRLPFPKIVLEVPYPSQGLNIENIRECTKRLILAEEGVCNLGVIDLGLHGIDQSSPFRPAVGDETPNCVKITVIAWYAEERKWIPIMASAIVVIGTRSQKATQTTPEEDPYWENRQQSVVIPFVAETFLPEVVNQFIQTKGYNEYKLTLSNDIGIEVGILGEMLAVLNCRNVGTEIINPSEKLNKSRIKAGKEPFHKYHILNVGGANLYGTSGSMLQGGDGYKVRQHLRRGHIRRISEDHTVWVNQTVVAAGSNKGEISKTYNMRKKKT
jgi:hypothetical protein